MSKVYVGMCADLIHHGHLPRFVRVEVLADEGLEVQEPLARRRKVAPVRGQEEAPGERWDAEGQGHHPRCVLRLQVDVGL